MLKTQGYASEKALPDGQMCTGFTCPRQADKHNKTLRTGHSSQLREVINYL